MKVTMAEEQKLIPLGHILRAHGVHGAVLVTPYGPPQRLLSGKGLWLISPDPTLAPRPVDLKGKLAGESLILKLKNIGTREAAESLKGYLLATDRKSLPPPEEDEYYLNDLLNLSVETTDGRSLGQVQNLMDTGAALILVIKDQNGHESLVPFTDEFVPSVDLAGGKLIVEAVPGLLDQN